MTFLFIQQSYIKLVNKNHLILLEKFLAKLIPN